LRLYRLSAQHGNTLSQGLLGELYFNGQGISQNYQRSYLWLNLSASGLTGNAQKSIADERDRAASKLLPSELAAAQTMGEQCRASNYKDCGIDSDGAVATKATEPKSSSTEPATNPASRRATQQTSSVVATGSGFYVSSQGHIVTNAHVVAGCAEVRSPKIGLLKLIAKDSESDLALLVTQNKQSSFARLQGGRGARLGETVVAIGFPLQGLLGSDPIVTTGTISALAGLKNDRRMIQISAPVQPGNSGGPLVGENGSVVGVVNSKLNAIRVARAIGDLPENVNFAVSLGTLQSFLNANAVPYELNDSRPVRSTADISADATHYSVLLECLK
jgi:S1-C subfamily serine protease